MTEQKKQWAVVWTAHRSAALSLQPCVVRLGLLVAQHQHTTPSPVDVVGRGTVLLAPLQKIPRGEMATVPGVGAHGSLSQSQVS